MKIVCNISEEDYAILLSHADVIRKRKRKTLEEAVINGTPLPKGHGDLIDRNDLLEWSYKTNSKYYKYDEVVDVDDIKNAPTIIEGSESE